MRKQERGLPRRVGRFNYWDFFRPAGRRVITPLKHYIKRQFHLILTASPTVWNKEVHPWLHKKLFDIPDRQFLALEGYVSDDKEWRCDGDAWDVYTGLSTQKQKRILELEKKTWGIQRKKLNWDTLLKTIAEDQAIFQQALDISDAQNVFEEHRRIYAAYHKQANKLLWPNEATPFRITAQGTALIRRTDQRQPKGATPPNLTTRRENKKTTLHWFHHALRNMREYRNNRPPIPWSPECAATCSRIQQKLNSR